MWHPDQRTAVQYREFSDRLRGNVRKTDTGDATRSEVASNENSIPSILTGLKFHCDGCACVRKIDVPQRSGRPMDKFESRQIVIGMMVQSSQEEEIDDLDFAKEQFDKFVADLVAGNSPDLEGPTVRALFRCSRKENGADRLKLATAKLLGLDPKCTYSEALFQCGFIYTRKLEEWRDGTKGYVSNWQEHRENVAA